MECRHSMTDTCPRGCHDDIDYDGEDWPDEEIGDGMFVVTVVVGVIRVGSLVVGLSC